MKLKMKFDKATIQEFFLLHVEKIVLGVVVCVLVLLVAMGYQLESVADSPEELQKKVTEATTAVNNPLNWDGMRTAAERQVALDIPEKVTKKEKPIKSNEYPPPVYAYPDFEKLHPRTDPKIYAPQNLVVTALSGPLAIKRDKDQKDPLVANLRTGTSGGPTPTPRPGPRTSDKQRPTTPRRPPGPGPGSEYEVEGMFMEGPGMDYSAGADSQRKPSQREDGFVPAGAETTWTSAHAIVVQAVVPWEKQFEEYRRCLEKSQDFRVDRDVPFYVFYVVERADVTSDPNADPATLKWAAPKGDKFPVYSYSTARKETDRWSGFPNEVLDPEYLDRALTHPAPPFIYRDLTGAMIHPDIPRVDLATGKVDESLQKKEQTRIVGPLDEEVKDPDGRSPYPGGEMGRDGRGRASFTHMRFGDSIFGKAGESAGSMAPGMVSGQGAISIDKLAESVRKYKLLRFTDVTVQPGRLYRYRVKVWVEDPNHPYVGSGASVMSRDPSLQSLDEKVKARLKAVAAEEQKKAAAAPESTRSTRIVHRESDWSAPSEPIGLPAPDHFYAAKVKPPVLGPVRDDRPLIVSKETEAHMVAVEWNDEKSLDIPGVAKVKRGTTLVFEPKKVEVKHPVTTQVQELPGHKFDLPAVVADIRGGEPVGNPKAKLNAPGEILVFDEHANWHFLSDTEDVDGVKRNIWDETLLDDEPPTPRPRPTTAQNPPPGSPEVMRQPTGPATKKGPGGGK